MQPKTQKDTHQSKLSFETTSIHSHKGYAILKSIMAYQLDEEIDSLSPIYFYCGEPAYLVEAFYDRNFCTIKHLVSTPRVVEVEIRKSMLANEDAFLNLLEEMNLVDTPFLFDGKNLAPVTFDDFEMDTDRYVNTGDIFCVIKEVGIVKPENDVFVYATSSKTEAFDLATLSLFNRLPFIQNPKNSIVFVGCLISTVLSGLFSGIGIYRFEKEIEHEFSLRGELARYLDSKLENVSINNSHITRMVNSLKTSKLKEILEGGKVEDNIIDVGFVMKDGEIAFLSRILEMGLNIFLRTLSSTTSKVIEVEMDVPNIGAKRIFIREGAAFVVPENNDIYKDVGYWIALLNSDNVALVQS